MNASTASRFESWFEEQRAKGLVDIKFALDNNKSTTVRSVQDELLVTEAMIQSNLLRNAPVPTSRLSEHVYEKMKGFAFAK